MWHHAGEEEEPEWVQTEREHFDKWRDLNKVIMNLIVENNH